MVASTKLLACQNMTTQARFKRGSGGEPHQQLPVTGKAGIRRHDRRPRLEGGGPAGPQPEWREPIAPQGAPGPSQYWMPVAPPQMTAPPPNASWSPVEFGPADQLRNDVATILNPQKRGGRAKRKRWQITSLDGFVRQLAREVPRFATAGAFRADYVSPAELR
jgi:hypothetical protein